MSMVSNNLGVQPSNFLKFLSTTFLLQSWHLSRESVAAYSRVVGMELIEITCAALLRSMSAKTPLHQSSYPS